MTINGANFTVTADTLCNDGSVQKYFTGGAPSGWSLGALGSGGSSTDLLTLNSANSGTSGYKYWSINDNDTTYAGAFKIPSGNHSGTNDDWNYADWPIIALNGSSKMFIAGRYTSSPAHKAGICELNIPTLSTSSSLASLNTATVSQDFYQPYNDAPSNTGDWGANGYVINGMCVVNSRLVVNYYARYDGSGDGFNDHNCLVLNGTTLNSTGLRGFFTGSNVAHYTGWISEIPAAHQSTFGGATHLMGNSGGNSRSINERNSVGPSLFACDFDASGSIVSASPPSNGSAIVPTPTAYQDYPLANPLTPLADLNTAGNYWSNLSEAYFGFIVPGTRTYMVVGESGGHSNGLGYSGTYYPNTDSDVDNHYWLFDVDDIAAASNVYDPEPYEHGAFTPKFEGTRTNSSLRRVRGGAYDSSTDTLYLAVRRADNTAGEETDYPVIVAYDFSGVNS